MCQTSVFMGRRQRRRAQINADILIINKINLRRSAYSAPSASGNINLTHPLLDIFWGGQSRALPLRVSGYLYSFTAITSISTKPFFGNVLTATAERAGKVSSN